MTIEEQDAAVGRLVREADSFRKMEASIESELDRAAESFKNTGSLLKQALRSADKNALDSPVIDSSLETLPKQDRLTTLLCDLREVRARHSDLRKQLSKLNLSF